jgi:16S rRNA (cytidine1402-2'-O)-methyltransferase
MMDVQRSFSEDNQGKLYLVATPIGNLEDMTFRAIRTLREVAWIAAEDTRQTRKLLTHYEIKNRLVSYHDHNQRTSGPELIEKLLLGESVALVSDAGMPAISDPGQDLVQLAIEAGVAVVPIPGANAALSALVISGLSTEQFRFVGFLPRDKKKQRYVLGQIAVASDTLIMYESPHRIVATLTVLMNSLGDRRIALIRELTKKFEEAVRGQINEILTWLEEHPPKGEYCIVIEGISEEAISAEAQAWWKPLTIEAHVAAYEAKGLDRKEAMRLAATDRGVSKRDIYNALLG